MTWSALEGLPAERLAASELAAATPDGEPALYCSPQWKRALGHTDAEIGSSSAEWLDRVHPDDRPLLSSLIAAQLGGDRTPLRFEHRVRTASGGYRRMLCSAITVLDEAGCPSRIVGALIDVTDCGDRERP